MNKNMNNMKFKMIKVEAIMIAPATAHITYFEHAFYPKYGGQHKK